MCVAVSLADVYACILRQIEDVNSDTVRRAWVLKACVRREICNGGWPMVVGHCCLGVEDP